MKSLISVTFLFVFCALTTSCSVTQQKFRTIETVKTKGYGWKDNYAIQSIDSVSKSRNLLELLELHRYNADSIYHLEVTSKALVIHFRDRLGGNHFLQYEGKLKRHCFEFYTEYKTLNFPPLLIMTQKTKFQLYRKPDASLVVLKSFDHSGMLFIMGAGNSGSYYSIFKSISR
ncbi:MAG: hypothetical protein ACK5RV_02725 [Flavobacterium sp.]|jgi:hypothetical protein|uniref:hypothetical protein n=1 Tax=Flavobacterium sp. TaxID=239 RepID=UPI0022C552C8|nr:hypothetical protein [Flavobacterium sp.]MCZ8168136.1 hypothetical protein [Flavobacterium sp.]MCZ8296175.1 hypothetical protein [Flavobacterium sp.]